VTLPATHTPGTAVAPIGPEGTALPTVCPIASTGSARRPSDSSTAERAVKVGETTSASRGTTAPEASRTPVRRLPADSTAATSPGTTVMPRAASC
jgi:hypothetical protein